MLRANSFCANAKNAGRGKIKTAETPRTRLMAKLDMHSLVELVRHAIRKNYRHSIACTATGDASRRSTGGESTGDDTS